MSKLVSFRILWVAVLGLTGCMLPKAKLGPEFWQDKEQTIPVYFQRVSAGINIQGSNFLSMKEDYAPSDVGNFINRRYDKDRRITGLQEDFIQGLTQRGIKAYAYEKNISIPDLKARKSEGPVAVSQSSASKALGIDTLLVLSVEQVGANRGYLYNVPAGDPEPVCSMTVELLDLRTIPATTLWSDTVRATEKVEGEWDDEPDYPDLSKALDKAIDRARKTVMDDFFGSAPPP